MLVRRCQSLLLRHLRKMALGLEEFLECPPFYNPSVVEDDDLIHVRESREAVGDTDDGSPFLQRIDGGLDLFFCSGIQGRGRFV